MQRVTASSKFRCVSQPPSTPAEIRGIALPLARAAINRAGELRLDPDRLAELWTDSAIVHFSSGRFHYGEGLTFFSAEQIAIKSRSSNYTTGERYFLGFDGERAYFAWCTEDVMPDEKDPEFKSLRAIGDELTDAEMGLAVHTQALANWHHTHQFCSRCGSTTTSALGGSVRKCDKDATEHYPRTDPAIIVLIKDREDRVLLGRQKVWPENRFSNFAGFVEPGESFENCVVREVEEESGLSISDVIYLGSQPWPFPASIMIAFHAITDNPGAARPDGEEIEEVRWYSRASMKSGIVDGTLLLPPAMSVSRRMLEAWYCADGSPITDLTGGVRWDS